LATPLERVFNYSFAEIFRLYVAKLARKERSVDDLNSVISWLTGFTQAQLEMHIADGSTLQQLFAAAQLTPRAELITGVICGVRVEQIEDPLMQKIRYLDKLVDELYKGKSLEKVLR
jgi:hypothetical protein